MSRIKLYTPKIDELDYRARLLSDKETMAYNRGYDLDDPNYHKDTGTIDFPESERADWYAASVGREPERFYAYVCRAEDGEFVGEVCARLEDGVYKIGIVIEGKYHGICYGTDAMDALLGVLFDKLGAAEVQNEFEDQRNAAVRMHRRAHFTPVYEKVGMVRFVLRRDVYEALKNA